MKALCLWPLLGLFLITPLTPYLDLAIARYFYSSTGQFTSTPFFEFLYNYGFLPADVIAGVALLLFTASYFLKQLHRLREPALICALSLLIGSGVIVHGVLKDHWGRPRPKQTLQFGGELPFRAYYNPNFFSCIPAKSFPCGHCSTGFYFFCVYFIGRYQKNQFLQKIGLIIAFGLGGSLSMARMAQGGHYLSDVLVSGLVMWWSAALCTFLVYKRKA